MVDEIFKDVFDEMKSRFTESFTDVSGADGAAIITAIHKAAWRGVVRGIALASYEFNARLAEVETPNPGVTVPRIDTYIHGADPEPDLWAEKYAEDS